MPGTVASLNKHNLYKQLNKGSITGCKFSCNSSLVDVHKFACERDEVNRYEHTCQLSPINREPPDFETTLRPPDRISKISQFSRFLDHLPICILSLKLKKSRRFLSFVSSRVYSFQGEGRPHFPLDSRISGQFR